MARGVKTRKWTVSSRKFWYIQEANEKIAMKLANHILCVNPNIKKRIEERFPGSIRQVGSDDGVGRYKCFFTQPL